MKLDEFVKRTLLDITNSVYEAKKISHVAIARETLRGQKSSSRR